MSYLALYRKWRPLVFEDMVEQEHVVETLKNSIISKRIAHAYLFSGTRGTGKTTMAKIFSRAVNCTDPKSADPCNKCEICTEILNGSLLDVIEIDAASNNGVENIRDLRDEVKYMPTKAKYKVYIIDEVHMLSTGAFNALLKTLEEPPSHVIFILATTESHKIPATILSRCQRFDFRRITVESISKRVEHIAKESGIDIKDEASRLIAKLSDGALRDAISILDQCISSGTANVTYEDVLKVTGLVADTFIFEVIDKIVNRDVGGVLKAVDTLVMEGKDIAQFASELVTHYRNLLICASVPEPGEIIDAGEDTIQKMKEQLGGLERFEIMSSIKELSSLEGTLKWSAHPRIMLEAALIKLCERRISAGDYDISERIQILEEKINEIMLNGVYNAKNVKDASKNGETEGGQTAKAAAKKTTAKSGARIPVKPGAKAHPEDDKNAKNFECWGDVLKELKDNGRMVLYTNLLNTKAIQINKNVIGIVFEGNNSFGKMYVSKAENLKVVESCLEKLMGNEIRIKCLEQEEMPKEQEEKREKDDGWLKKAKDIATRFDVSLDIVDE